MRTTIGNKSNKKGTMATTSAIKQRSQWVLAILSGLLLALAFPSPEQSWAAWIALVPLLLALRKATPKMGFGLGFASGFVANLALVHWTVHAMHVYGYIPWVQSISVLILFAGILALFGALFGWSVTKLCRRGVHMVWLAPATWVALEYVRTWIFSGFPWALLGYSQYRHIRLIQFADLFGVYGVSALIVFFNAVLVLAILFWIEKKWQQDTVTQAQLVKSGGILLATIIVVIVYGIFRLSHMNDLTLNSPKASLAVIQGNIDQSQKWDAAFQVVTTAKYRNLSLAAADGKADLIIWPETATPFYLFEDPLLTGMVLEGIQQGTAAYIIGSPSVKQPPGPDSDYFNSAYLITPKGTIAGKYDKVHLVPFGEYVPLKKVLFFIDKMVAQVGDFQKGTPGRNLQWDKFNVGMLICYEGIFPSLARAMVKNNSNLLVIITNDAWFGRTSAPMQHFSMAVFRAVENHRFLARAANTGISGFIDPSGRIMGTTELFTETSLTATVALLEGKTLYCLWGDWPFGAACLILLVTGAINRRRLILPHDVNREKK